ncbi:hypothetical protein B0O99DRAFT_683778 [Bisporella sp. PMI_857]|nr:hypothetical protein B0O99DRAFT_683778 [Bisporella sp. PMI_857]
MRRLRAVSRLGDAVANGRTVFRGSRYISTALQRQFTPPSSQASRHPPQESQSLKRIYCSVRHASSSATASDLRKTPLYDLHVANGATMVPFGGFLMPVQYSSLGVGASHHFTRSHASLFDVSHMVQHYISGPGANAFLEKITPASIKTLKNRNSTLSTLLWPVTGGIVDDTIITRVGPEAFYVVTNAGCREKDIAYLTEQKAEFEKTNKDKVNWNVLEGVGLVALQGPLSAEILESLIYWPNTSKDEEKEVLDKLYFGQMQFIRIKLLNGEPSDNLLVSRGGYTGEDGFEISIPPHNVVAVTEALLGACPERLQLAGLGARDSLRLEAGMCLYGHDLNDTITPVEGGLSWIIGSDRKASGGFHGSDVILKQLLPKSKRGSGVEKRRVGFIVEGAPAREHCEVVAPGTSTKIGVITSGCPSPTLKKNIAMGYIETGYHKPGTDVEIVVRGKPRKAKVSKMPFVAPKYYKQPLAAQDDAALAENVAKEAIEQAQKDVESERQVAERYFNNLR